MSRPRLPEGCARAALRSSVRQVSSSAPLRRRGALPGSRGRSPGAEPFCRRPGAAAGPGAPRSQPRAASPLPPLRRRSPRIPAELPALRRVPPLSTTALPAGRCSPASARARCPSCERRRARSGASAAGGAGAGGSPGRRPWN